VVRSLDGQLAFRTLYNAVKKSFSVGAIYYDVEACYLQEVMFVEINYTGFQTLDKKPESLAIIVVWLLPPFSFVAQADLGHVLANCRSGDVTAIHAFCTPHDPASFDHATMTLPWKGGGHDAENRDESWKTNSELRKTAPQVADEENIGEKRRRRGSSAATASASSSSSGLRGDEGVAEFYKKPDRRAACVDEGGELSYDMLKAFVIKITKEIADKRVVLSRNGVWFVNQLSDIANKPLLKRRNTLVPAISELLDFLVVSDMVEIFIALGWPMVGEDNLIVAGRFLHFVLQGPGSSSSS
jgi:hypothetical protein